MKQPFDIWRSGLLAVCGIALGALTMGCGGVYDADVEGVVKLDGQPIPRGTVSFSSEKGHTAYGMVQSDGTYHLRTGREDGLPPGNYSVTVAANEASTTPGRDGGPPPVGKAITPDWYRDPATSGLTFDVQPGGNEINIDLTTTPPPGWKPPPGRR
jgi:hypothetical protein